MNGRVVGGRLRQVHYEPIAYFNLRSSAHGCEGSALRRSRRGRRNGYAGRTSAAPLQFATSVHLFFICSDCDYVLVRGNRTGSDRYRALLLGIELFLHTAEGWQSALGLVSGYLRAFWFCGELV